MVEWKTQNRVQKPVFKDEDTLFLNEKPARLLIELLKGDDYGSSLSKKIDTTYAHTTKILGQLEDYGFTTTTKEGRKKTHTLTEKGREKAEALRELVEAGKGENQ